MENDGRAPWRRSQRFPKHLLSICVSDLWRIGELRLLWHWAGTILSPASSFWKNAAAFEGFYGKPKPSSVSWFCFRVFSQSRRHPDQMLGRSPLVPQYAAEQQLYSALGCLSPSHSLQGHAQAEETHFSCLYLWLHSFGYYIKLMTIGEDGNVVQLGLSTPNVLCFVLVAWSVLGFFFWLSTTSHCITHKYKHTSEFKPCVYGVVESA